VRNLSVHLEKDFSSLVNSIKRQIEEAGFEMTTTIFQ